ncbi:RDD family protein [Streptomyces liangshanensis]|uniref:RDD family protein n=1 Tax=Streptomyces liangshanensis TaxID=2717324 RepID=UPI0036DE10A0
MSFGDPQNPYGQQPGQPGQPGQPPQPGYGYPQQAPQGVPQQGYGYPQSGGPAPYAAPQGPGYGGMPELAGWGSRVLGTLVDGLVLLVPYIIVFAGAAIGGGFGTFLRLIGLLAVFAVAIWQLIQEGKTGQTIGKKALNIRLLRESDGQPLGVGMAFVRRLAHFLDGVICYIGFLWPLWDSKNQTLADKVCSSLVIKSN